MKLTCLRCNGVGLIESNRLRVIGNKTFVAKGSRICASCDGKGKIEQAQDFKQLAANDR